MRERANDGREERMDDRTPLLLPNLLRLLMSATWNSHLTTC